MVEGNHYVPRDSIKVEYVRNSEVTSRCPWKGDAEWCDVSIDREVNTDAEWRYDHPNEAARQIERHYREASQLSASASSWGRAFWIAEATARSTICPTNGTEACT